MAVDLKPLHSGKKGELHRQFQAALNRRLRARGLNSFVVKEDGHTGARTLLGARKAAWALGALSATYEEITKTGVISVGVQRMVRNPGKRTPRQLEIARKRLGDMAADRKKRAAVVAAVHKKGGARSRIVKAAQHAAANYRQRPGAYHYLAGGRANLVYLEPTPRDWRSDCSQFAASVYKDCGLPSPATVPHEFASTYSIEPHGRVTTNPRPGDLGMYGPHGRTHHVEIYCGEPGQEFIGHGSPPIDSLTPGRPDFYVTFSFLD